MILNKDNYVIGITGGVGAGKSMVLYILENNYNAKIFQADRIARGAMAFDGPVHDRVLALFGEEILFPDGTFDRNKMAEILFKNPEMLEKQNAIIHPAVRRFLRMKASSVKGLVVLEAALPEECNFKDICDEIWYIHTDKDVRIERLMETRGYTKEKCTDIINNQLSEEKFRELSTRVIDNSGSLEKLEEQIASAMKEIKSKDVPDLNVKTDRSEDTKGGRAKRK